MCTGTSNSDQCRGQGCPFDLHYFQVNPVNRDRLDNQAIKHCPPMSDREFGGNVEPGVRK
jgi:hypothetical protein